MKIVSSAKIRKDLQEQLVQEFPQMNFEFYKSMEEAEASLKTADVLITLGEDVTPEHINSAEHLQWMMVISAGMDKLPFEELKAKNIQVTNARGIHKSPMAEYTFAMILDYARQRNVIRGQEQAKLWNRRVTMTEINQQTLGVLGAGAIGEEIGRIGSAFGMETLACTRSGKPSDNFTATYTSEELHSFLNRCDYVVSVLPATDVTYHMAGEAFFKAMKAEAVFMNIGRGQTVNENALLDALDKKEITHAILDVFEEEPLPGSHPFWEHSSVTVTPHISGISPQYQDRAIALFVENLHMYLADGRFAVNEVNLDRGY
ncbi:phosphoglycerate dehydrogenase-like enzyme [Salsuginibacillus halophilus]|uniref:Phosphoglycerate dehydrogenase-like enzyme n=1 Tax=Salsuginibacillus halophilus TaxID=517424 RepID=A0A2P8HBQ8_9BACI|nr:D-2-hydroxyacid dehydrogenase [Salsuginibacillus halophilus]PSL43658.1 phosphoglycerate dehydrogenase-like enzyme [Salsuginibacillus halophilus]